jgi:hypothetical protein
VTTLTQYLIKNDLLAAFVALGLVTLSYVGLPGGVFASILVAFITLRKGWKSGFLVLSFIAVPGIALLLRKQLSIFDLIFLQSLLAYSFACVLRIQQSWRLLLQLIIVIGLVGVGLAHVIVPDVSAQWLKLITWVFQRVQDGGVVTADQTAKILTHFKPWISYLSGFLVFALSGSMLCQLLMARFWQLRSLAMRGAFKAEFIQIRLGYIEAVLFSAVLLGVLFHISFAKDVLFVFVMPFMFAGLAYLHYLQQRFSHLIVVLVICYVGLLVTPLGILFALGLAIIGYADSILNLRKRFTL